MSKMRMHLHSPQKTADNRFFLDSSEIYILEERLEIVDGGISMKDPFPYKVHFFFSNPERKDGANNMKATVEVSGYGKFTCVRSNEDAFKAGILEIEFNPFSESIDKADEAVCFILDRLIAILSNRPIVETIMPEEKQPEEKVLYNSAPVRYIIKEPTPYPEDDRR